ncbi:MAG: TlpA family protein disulfide reductase [Phycisphaeraceae bacterium]|nr:TlpA family protein disulfide reductase [Phycisphaeraceae bacterium]
MCGISKSSMVLVGVGAIAAALALSPVATSSAWAGEKSGAKPGSPAKSSKLVAGAKAPEFNPTNWVKGDPVKSFESGKVYVVEFWATWCPPCRESIPHLTSMQKKFKDDATIIGMASYERPSKGGGDDRLAKVEKFVKDQGDKMNYTVAFEKDGKVGELWMEAAKQEGIPAAFVVGGDGKIAWIGSPLDKTMEKKIEAAIKAAKPAKKPGDKPSDSEKR